VGLHLSLRGFRLRITRLGGHQQRRVPAPGVVRTIPFYSLYSGTPSIGRLWASWGVVGALRTPPLGTFLSWQTACWSSLPRSPRRVRLY